MVIYDGRDAITCGVFEEVTWRCLFPYAFSVGTPRGEAYLAGWLGFFVMIDLEK